MADTALSRTTMCVLAAGVVALSVIALAGASTGALTPQGCIADVGDVAGCGRTQQGLDGPTPVAVSPDGKSAYVVTALDDAIVRFDRDTTTGALAPAGCIADVGDAAGCGATQQGLDGARGVAVSPDGRSVYVGSALDDAIVRFDRDTTTGALTPAGCVADVGDAAGCGVTQQGLDSAFGVAVSADGKSVYVASFNDRAVVRFVRNTTSGALTPAGCFDDTLDLAGCGVTQQGLDGAAGVSVSPDGKSVYVAAEADDAIVRFDRNTTTGGLTPAGCIADAGSAIGCAATQQGLDNAIGVSVSPDGKSVYVASQIDDTIVRFDRDTTTGALTPAGCIADAASAIGCAATQQGLNSAYAVAVSADGKSVYVASESDDAIVRFDRDTTTGGLTPAGCIADAGNAAGCGTSKQGLDGATGVAVSPDGKSAYAAASVDDAISRFNREDPPETQIDSGPSGTTNDNTPTFTFSSDESGVGFECRIDGEAFAACSGPGAAHTTGTLADGAHTFDVRAKDYFGTADATPASQSFSVDATAPETTIQSGPADGSVTNDATPTFAFSASETDSMQCRIDGGAYAACSSPTTTTLLSDGAHSFAVRATDAAGNTDPTPATRQFKVDTHPPQTKIVSGPRSGTTRDRTPTFRLKSSERGSTFQCALDHGRYKRCKARTTTRRLRLGRHALKVRARDRAGNVDRTPARARFKVVR